MTSLALGGGKRGNRGLTQSVLDDGLTHLPGDNSESEDEE